jgi:general secretion pathway protein K
MKNKFFNNRGVALITVILIVAILVAVVIELNRSSRADIYDAANISDGIKLAYIAKSGFYGAAAVLSNSENDYFTLRDDWAHMEKISMQSNALFNNGYFSVIIEDETGKIPLNKLAYDNEYYKVLIRLLQQPEFGLDERKAEEIADSIIDWIDTDDNVPGYGAENSYYASQVPPYEAKNAPMDCIEELLMIKGVTKEIFYGTKEKPSLVQYVTAVESNGAINVNTAPKMVLRSLADGISPEIADKMDDYRTKEGNDLKDTKWFKDIAAGMTINVAITSQSNYFKIISTGKMSNMAKTINGIVKKDKKTIQIIKWRQD